MELKPIEELLKFRKKLVKQLDEPMPPLTDEPTVAAAETDLWRLGIDAQKRLLQDIDAQIRERTGGLVDPESGTTCRE